MAAVALDVSHPQVLIDFMDDANFQWHHRLLLVRGQVPGQWIGATPTLSVQFINLTTHRVKVLMRNGPLPEELAGNMFCFDPLEPGELMRLEEEARLLSVAIGFEQSTVSDGTWTVSDPRHAAFGSKLPDDAIRDANNFVARGDRGLVLIDDSWIYCEKVLDVKDCKANFAAASGSMDDRLSGDSRDKKGVRFVELSDALKRFQQHALEGWPFGESPHVAPEFLDNLHKNGQNLTSHHIDLVKRSGLLESSAVAHQHRFLSELARLLVSFDQFDVSNCASAELLFRGLARLETAIARNPKAPDFSGLDDMLLAGTTEVGGAQTTTFNEWYANVQKNKAIIMKRQRLYREELDSQRKHRNDRGNKDRANE